MLLLSYSSTYRRTGRPFHCFWGDSPGWHCVGGLLEQGSSAVAKLLQSLVTVRKVGRQVGITVWQGNTKGQFERLWERTEVAGGTCLCVRVCLFVWVRAHLHVRNETGRHDSFGSTCMTFSKSAIHNLTHCSESRVTTMSPSATKCQQCHLHRQ